MVYHVDNKTAPRVKPHKEPVFDEAVRWFTDQLGDTPTVPQADWFNMVQAELLGLAEVLGVTPDKLDDNQLGIALTKAFEKVGADIPKVLDSLGEDRNNAASQRIVNVVNKLAKDAMQSALQANDKANQAKQEAYEAKQLAEKSLLSVRNITRNSMLVSSALSKLTQTKSLNIVCVGDSITYGFDTVSVDNIPPSPGHLRKRALIQYPLQLERELRRIYSTQNINVINYGYSGDTVKTSFERDIWKVNPKCELAIIMFGINDRHKKVPISEYINYLELWIERLNEWGTGVIIATSTMLKSGGDNSITKDYRIASENLAKLKGCAVIATDEFVENYENSQIYSDDTHFNKEGYRILGNIIAWFIASGCKYIIASSSIILQSDEQHSITNGDRYLSEGSYNTSTYQLLLATDKKEQVTFTFYLNAEAAELYLSGYIGAGSSIIIDSDNLRARSFFKEGSSTTDKYVVKKDVRTYPQLREVFCAKIFGRGWHNLTITSPTSAKINPEYLGTYIGYLKVKPIEQVEIFSDVANRVDKRSFVIFDPQIQDEEIPAPSLQNRFVVPSSVIPKTRTNHSNWHSNMPIKITIYSASASVPPQVSENYIQMYKSSEFVVINTLTSSSNAPKVVSMKRIGSNDVEIEISREYPGFIKLFIEANDVPFSNSLLSL